jgi:hypothetical protein
LLIFVLLELDGAVNRHADNYSVARALRLTPTRVKGLRRDAYARWRPLIGEERRDALRRILSSVLTAENIAAGAKHSSEKNRKEGFLAVRIEHPDDHAEFEQAIIDVGAIPVYERNREVLDVRFDTLIRLSEVHGFVTKDPKKIRTELKNLAPAAEELEDFLRKPVNDVTRSDARSVLNSVGATAVAEVAAGKIEGLLKLIFPFLK